MANFEIIQSPIPEEKNDFNFSNLYLFHTPLGPNRNQFGVTSSDSATGLGSIIVNNWPIYDGAGPNAAIVARAQGMHVYAGNWNNVFSIVFEIQRYIQKHLYVRSIQYSKSRELVKISGFCIRSE